MNWIILYETIFGFKPSIKIPEFIDQDGEIYILDLAEISLEALIYKGLQSVGIMVNEVNELIINESVDTFWNSDNNHICIMKNDLSYFKKGDAIASLRQNILRIINEKMFEQTYFMNNNKEVRTSTFVVDGTEKKFISIKKEVDDSITINLVDSGSELPVYNASRYPFFW